MVISETRAGQVLSGGEAGVRDALPVVDDPRSTAPADARELSRLFFARLRELEEGTPEYQYARNTLIELNMGLVHFGVRRFRSGAVETEDMVQVGMIGMIKAIDRFDLSREVEFVTFAMPYITGEIKRFFRDATWALHVPRRLQERRQELARAQDDLISLLGRAPRTAELAEVMQIPEKEVAEAQRAANGYHTQSLDAPIGSEGMHRADRPLSEMVGGEDPTYELIENCHALGPLLAELAPREQEILRMRFAEELTQAQIGERIGVSQMQVSRLLTRTLGRLRRQLLIDESPRV
ncbi:SigB/SigF/SigG family RNA polymerase sigma factor [Streptomyces physcomitrii]|uniref:SigB/SigF/SigG family RNA polymerase sigma factor n=1 Tax=Streptomyces physcomitrii TaxID=2724184 RepID=A0ABX1H2Z4_9ACTN|nr:SigB/SigF/SigG family RNA polymerase sigma factor [Streptomyces physcomitrii]NKI42427.1 SigB/SigF/SigG family RNA polymerase sigma factor [Streptomyces physcomitrii]